MPFAKISFHTVMTWVILAVVFLAGSMIGHTYGDAWDSQGWKIIPAMLYVCGAAYSLIWLIQLGDRPRTATSNVAPPDRSSSELSASW